MAEDGHSSHLVHQPISKTSITRSALPTVTLSGPKILIELSLVRNPG
jgi:hypothetical protein